MFRTFVLLLALGQSVPQGGPGTVTMSRAEYDRLIDLASRKPASETAPSATLTHADIRVRVAGPSARATMRVDGEVFRPGVAKVTLIKGATLLEARMEDRPLAVVAESGGHVALVNGPGAFSATLEVGTALSPTPGRGAFVLPVPSAASVTASIDVPGDQTDVHLSTGLILRRSSANGRTTIEATLQPGTPAEVWWSTHDSVPANGAARDVRLLSTVKSIVTIGDADVRLLSLVDVTIVQGDPSQIAVTMPAGYELVSVSGASLERPEAQAGRVVLFVTDPALRKHQFLVSLERQHTGGSFKLETGFPTLPAAQRETGEVAIEGLGTIDVTSALTPGLRRMDVRELDPSLAAASRQALLAAYRYQRTADAPPALALDVRRFADAEVLAAVAERAVATTLVSTEGRALTEITMWIRNRAQPFMKVALPPGATMLSVEVGGSPAKPVEGTDGSRVPLLRPGFRPEGAYSVSFVYLHSGTPFLKKGDMQMTLPKMDVPVNVVEWELFVPDRFRVDRFDGDMFDAALMPVSYIATELGAGFGGGVSSGAGGGTGVSSVAESVNVTVTANAPVVNTRQTESVRNDPQPKKVENDEPSVNVQNLQRRASGVLPVRMEVPRAGTSHRFVKPLVIDEETRVSFRYKRR
jgi:hypothetical protein